MAPLLTRVNPVSDEKQREMSKREKYKEAQRETRRVTGTKRSSGQMLVGALMLACVALVCLFSSYDSFLQAREKSEFSGIDAIKSVHLATSHAEPVGNYKALSEELAKELELTPEQAEKLRRGLAAERGEEPEPVCP